MHILIINFNLHELGHDQYESVCNELAPMFAGLPGLISKHWLTNPETNTYGGVYVWESEQALLDYKESDIFKSIGANPNFVNATVTDFGILADASKVTRVG